MLKQMKGLCFRFVRRIHTESKFLQVWKEVSNDLLNRLEKQYLDHPMVEEIEGNDQLLKLSLTDGKTFIVNRQMAKREIWYSSPISGPSHFRYDDAKQSWMNKNDKELYSLIKEDLASVLK